MQTHMIVGILVAATLPFVASIFSAFSPSTRVKDIDGYFLFDRELDIDSFLKTTVGYSLQAASIALFFYWTFSNGITGPIVVCVAWTGGYWLMAFAVQCGRFDDFLRMGLPENTSMKAETIHGFIGERIGPESHLKRWAILAVSAASIIGLGGTMMAEIDYSTQFFLTSIQISNPSELIRLSVEITVLAFTVLYVLWGGYKSAVFTDRFQVPLAYVAFSVFGFGAAFLAATYTNDTGTGYLVSAIIVLLSLIFWNRRRLLREVLPLDSWDQLTTFFTFIPIIIAGIFLLYYLSRATSGAWSTAILVQALHPSTPTFLGFGVWGTIALVVANGIWQFIDISSLQRLRSIDADQVTQHRGRIVHALRVTGTEAGIGWLLIAITAAILRTAGFSNDAFMGAIAEINGSFGFLIPVFIFTVTVYMLSTISGFISALSFVSYYDIIPTITNRLDARDGLSIRLQAARTTTLAVISAIFLLYLLLRLVLAASGSTAIATILYAIYAFQVVILPSAIVAIFFRSWKVDPLAVICSVGAGIIVAYWAATDVDGWKLLTCIGMNETSWIVFPPLASAFVSVVVYSAIASCTWVLQRMKLQ
jgi:hypothetical protein